GLNDWLDDDELQEQAVDEAISDEPPEGFEEVQVAALNEDDELLEELENSSFDDMLEGMESDDEILDELIEDKPKLDNPDLDLEALFEEDVDPVDEDFVEVDELLTDTDDNDGKERDIDLSTLDLPELGDD